jgi:hypothetical protein
MQVGNQDWETVECKTIMAWAGNDSSRSRCTMIWVRVVSLYQTRLFSAHIHCNHSVGA